MPDGTPPRAGSSIASPTAVARDLPVGRDRHEQAKIHREAKEKERSAVLEQRVTRKSHTGGRDDEIARLESVLGAGGLSAAACAGMKKQLASLQAAKLREERKRKASGGRPADLRAEGADEAPAGEVKDARKISQEVAAEVSQEEGRARDLFAEFLHHGRGSRTWTKNDLRLVNAFVVQKEFPGEKLSWQHVELALDELQGMISDKDPEPQRAPPPPARDPEPARGYPPRGENRPASGRAYSGADTGRSYGSPANRYGQPAREPYGGDDRRDDRYDAPQGGFGAPTGYGRRAKVVHGAGTAPWANSMNDPDSQW
jgi:hypothetical protein